MDKSQQFEIPQQVRDLVERNIEQTRSAYGQFMDAARQAQHGLMEKIAQVNPLTAGFTEIQERALKFTQQNLDANFQLASELAKAKDFKEAMEIQAKHAQTQAQAYASQAQELGTALSAAAQKAKPGA